MVFNTPSLVYNDNDNDSFGRTITTVSVADKATFSVVKMKSYDQYNLSSNTTFGTTSNTSFSATQATTSTSHVFPYIDIDSLLPATYNKVFSTGNNERSSVAITTKTYKLLQATFILILTSLILLIVQSLFLILSLVDVFIL